MPTREDWLPYGISERRLFLINFGEKIDDLQAVLGLTNGEIERIHEIVEAYNYAALLTDSTKATMKALVTWRDAVMSGAEPERPISGRPLFDNSSVPAGTSASLIYEFRKIVKRIKSSNGYSRTIGSNLGILPPNHVKTPLRELQPDFTFTAENGFRVKVAGSLLGTSAVRVEFKRKGDENWTLIDILTKLPYVLAIEPNVPGEPETVSFRCILIKDNKPVGNYTTTATVTLFAI